MGNQQSQQKSNRSKSVDRAMPQLGQSLSDTTDSQSSSTPNDKCRLKKMKCKNSSNETPQKQPTSKYCIEMNDTELDRLTDAVSYSVYYCFLYVY